MVVNSPINERGTRPPPDLEKNAYMPQPLRSSNPHRRISLARSASLLQCRRARRADTRPGAERDAASPTRLPRSVFCPSAGRRELPSLSPSDSVAGPLHISGARTAASRSFIIERTYRPSLTRPAGAELVDQGLAGRAFAASHTRRASCT